MGAAGAGLGGRHSGKREEIHRLRFNTEAQLFLAERDPTGIFTPGMGTNQRITLIRLTVGERRA